jgi:3-phosphoshikimate 1-carboxyvinyltransferase
MGGTVSGYNDHRIVMAMTIASMLCENPVIIEGAEAVNKSYPTFFEDFKSLGGEFRVI